MNWVHGLGVASSIFAIAIAAAGYVFVCIYLLQFWGIIPALLPFFFAIAWVEAHR